MKRLVTFLVFFLLTTASVLAQPQGEHLRKGHEYMVRGDPLRAEGQYLLAIEVDPESGEAHARLGEIYAGRKKYQIAIRHFERSISLGYREPTVFIRLALSHKSSGDLDKAILVYEKFVEYYPDLPEAHLGLGGLYDEKGMKSEAEEEYGLYRELKKIK